MNQEWKRCGPKLLFSDEYMHGQETNTFNMKHDHHYAYRLYGKDSLMEKLKSDNKWPQKDGMILTKR